jgi:hypothetical protein
VAEQVGREAELRLHEAPRVNMAGIEETVTDKGYHSGAVVKRMKAYGCAATFRRRNRRGGSWAGKAVEQQAVYANRRRVLSEYGKSLLRRRGELVERSFAHCYETGALRRCHRRGREHSAAATHPRGCIQSQPDPAQTARRGHATGVEEPLRQACFDPFLTLPVSVKSEAALLKPNLYVRCQVLREIAYPTTSPDLPEIRYFHPGLLTLLRGGGGRQ